MSHINSCLQKNLYLSDPKKPPLSAKIKDFNKFHTAIEYILRFYKKKA